jgi:hypothetical protein
MGGCPVMTDCMYGQRAQTEQRRPPLLHVFGHLHGLYGVYNYISKDDKLAILMNASQELVINIDPVGGGTPLVIELPIRNKF